MSEPFAIVLFDGDCAFCDRSVKWIIDHDRAARLRFAPQQSPVGKQMLVRHRLPVEGIESMVLIEADRVSTHSTAVLRIARSLPWPWKLCAAGLVIPRPMRDMVYSWIARRRYKIAGKLEACSIPTHEQQSRILDDQTD